MQRVTSDFLQRATSVTPLVWLGNYLNLKKFKKRYKNNCLHRGTDGKMYGLFWHNNIDYLYDKVIEQLLFGWLFPVNYSRLPVSKAGWLLVINVLELLNNFDAYFSGGSYRHYFLRRCVQSALKFLHVTLNIYQ